MVCLGERGHSQQRSTDVAVATIAGTCAIMKSDAVATKRVTTLTCGLRLILRIFLATKGWAVIAAATSKRLRPEFADKSEKTRLVNTDMVSAMQRLLLLRGTIQLTVGTLPPVFFCLNWLLNFSGKE